MKFRWYQRSLSLLVALVMLVQLVPGQCFAVGTDVFVDSTDIGDIIEESTNDTTAPPEQAEPAKVVGEDHSKTENRPLSFGSSVAQSRFGSVTFSW